MKPAPKTALHALRVARHDEHRDATEDEDQHIEVEHVGTSPFVQASRASEGARPASLPKGLQA